MIFELRITPSAEAQIQAIMIDRSKVGLQKQLKKAFSLLQNNPNHPGLNSHPLSSFDKIFQVKVFQAHRILWTYGPGKAQITILSVIPHY